MDQLSIHVPGTARSFARITRLPLLARLQVANPDAELRGLQYAFDRAARGAHRLVHSIFGQPAPAALEISFADRSTLGISVDARMPHYVEFVSRSLHGGYRPLETLLLDAMLPQARVFFDVGAQWGYFTWLALTNPGFKGTVYSFEQSPALVAELERIRDGGRFNDVHVMPYGLADYDGVATQDASRNRTPISVKRLDDLDLPPPDLIRIGTPGLERAMLEGASATIRAHLPAIMFGSLNPLSEDAPILFDLLRDNGYRFHVVQATESGVALSPAAPETVFGPGDLFAAPQSRLAALLGDHHIADPPSTTSV